MGYGARVKKASVVRRAKADDIINSLTHTHTSPHSRSHARICRHWWICTPQRPAGYQPMIVPHISDQKLSMPPLTSHSHIHLLLRISHPPRFLQRTGRYAQHDVRRESELHTRDSIPDYPINPKILTKQHQRLIHIRLVITIRLAFLSNSLASMVTTIPIHMIHIPYFQSNSISASLILTSSLFQYPLSISLKLINLHAPYIQPPTRA